MKKYTIFAGVNGAGKSTLYRLNEKIATGTVRINYHEILREQYIFVMKCRYMIIQFHLLGSPLLRMEGLYFNIENWAIAGLRN